MTERPSPIAALTAFFVALAGIAAFDGLFAMLYTYGMPYGETSAYVASIAFQGMIFAVPTLLYYRKKPDLMPAMRLRRLDPLCAVWIVLAAVVGMLAFNWISIYWTMLLRSLGLTVSTGNEAAPRTLNQLAWMLVVSAMMPALCEEMLFRGLLLPSLEPLGPRWAVAVSGVMFALMHGRVEALPAHLLLGGMLAMLVLRTDSLFAAMLYHAVYNASIMVLAYATAQIDLAALDAIPTAAEGLQSMPLALVLLGGWAALVRAAMRRGERTRHNALSKAANVPLSVTARVMLATSAVLLIALEIRALLAMLPKGGA